MQLKLTFLLCFNLILLQDFLFFNQKHKEWLNQRRQQKSNRLALLVNHPKSNYEMANLWRFPKSGLETSANEVFPESEADALNVQQQQPSTTTTPTTSTLPITTTKGLETTSAGTTIDNTAIQTVLAATPATATATAITTTATATPTMQQPTTESIKVLNDFKTVRATAAVASVVTTTTARGAGVPEAPIISDNAVTQAPKIVVGTKTTTVRTTTTTSTESSQTTAVGNVSDLRTGESSAVTSTRRPNVGPRQRAYPRWANWGKWSDCSRSCGGGVRFQQRKCINR